MYRLAFDCVLANDIVGDIKQSPLNVDTALFEKFWYA
jgi:hypothetical protein